VTESGSRNPVRHVTVSADRAGQRLDNFLMSMLGHVPRGLIYRLVRTGQVRINGGRAKPMKKLKAGDEVRIPPVNLDPPEKVELPRGLVDDIRSRILEQTDDYIVLEKPSGLAMHGGSGLAFGLMDVIGKIDGNWRPVHRLDRPTSGLLVLACHHQALVRLQKAFSRREVDKRYFALLCGELAEETITIDQPLKKIRDGSGQRRIIVAEDGQSARSHFRVLERLGGFCFVEVEIETGRTHQIRAHAAWMNHPVAGDELYNDQADPAGLTRLFLHAHYLRLPWPEDHIISSPLPQPLAEVLDGLRAASSQS
jgi:23S rRNA pseudouridine955/2504/2580 synthase